MFEVFKKFFQILRDPEGYRRQQEAEFERERQKSLEEAAKVKIVTKSEQERRRFQTLAEALDFIVTCLENDNPVALGVEMVWPEGYLRHSPDRPDYFLRTFGIIRDWHHKADIRTSYQDRDFPPNEDRFRLGGSIGSPLSTIFIDFVKSDAGWMLYDIGVLR
jgi:hypothetical protein